MAIIQEDLMLEKLEKAKKVLLVEPNYKTTHPPLGLAKIKAFLDERGIESKYSRTILPEKFDLICVTSLFTYYSKHVFNVLHNRGLFNADTPMLVGGVFASMMPEQIDGKFKNVDVFRGYSKVLDSYRPDEKIMASTGDPWDKYSYVFTSRGCVNKCAYCVVWRIEKGLWVNPTWENQVFLDRPYIMLSDNNLSAVAPEHLYDIVNFTLKHDKRILFNSGFDCKHMFPEIAKELAKLKYCQTGMRLAFDRIEEDGVFQNAIEMLVKAGVKRSKIQAYVLFNFNDRPKDALYRARECARMKITPYPQRYVPLNTLDKDKIVHIGKHWTLPLTNAFRFFWLMRGIYNHTKFEDFLKQKKSISSFHLTEKDIAMFESNGVN